MLTFSYIVSLSVSENVSGVAILASNLERVGKIHDGAVGFCNLLTRPKQFRLLLMRAEACGEGSKSKRAGMQEAALRLQQRWCWWPKLWTQGTIELRNAVRGALLDILYKSKFAAAVKHEAFVPALTAPRVLVRGAATSN